MLYLIANGPMPTTAAQVAVTTGTAIKTLLQVKPINPVRIVEWGISFDGSAAATPIKVELLEADVAATVTASADADVTKFQCPGELPVASTYLTLGASATGYTASAEGTITAVRMLDLQFIAPSGQYVKQFPLGREPSISAAKFARVRVTAGAAVNAYCYLVLEL
jgi:hypothetical protein